MSEQQSLQAAASDGPDVGVRLETDEHVHYAHVRYAASSTPGVIWFDPRDGHERLSLDIDRSIDDLDVGESVLVGVDLFAKHNRCALVDAEQDDWVLEVTRAEHVTRESVTMGSDLIHDITYATDTESFDSIYEARAAAAERVDAYAEAEYRNAVAARVDSVEGQR